MPDNTPSLQPISSPFQTLPHPPTGWQSGRVSSVDEASSVRPVVLRGRFVKLLVCVVDVRMHIMHPRGRRIAIVLLPACMHAIRKPSVNIYLSKLPFIPF